MMNKYRVEHYGQGGQSLTIVEASYYEITNQGHLMFTKKTQTPPDERNVYGIFTIEYVAAFHQWMNVTKIEEKDDKEF